MRQFFGKLASGVSAATGSSWAFFLAFMVVVVWAVTGPIFGFSDTWQLVINTGTTIVTFLMVFLIQHTQNRDTQAMHLKLDELLRAVAGARENVFANLQEQEEQVIQQVGEELREATTSASPEQHAGQLGHPAQPPQPVR
jgi:low affinity Fe/Cu permease